MLQKCDGNWPSCPAVAVGVAQVVERQTVDLDVAGSNPVTHPKFQFSNLRIFRMEARLGVRAALIGVHKAHNLQQSKK